MADLRRLLSGLGYTGVVTLLNSGNAVFRSATGPPGRHAADITAAISRKLHLDVPVIVKTASELETIISENPIAAAGSAPRRLLVAFVQDSAALSGLKAVEALVAPPEKFAIGRNAAYLFCPPGVRQSKAWKALLGKEGRSATTRNWQTVLKLQALATGANPDVD